jgi:hypothetical protein
LCRQVQAGWLNGCRAFACLGHFLGRVLRGRGCCPQDGPDKKETQGKTSGLASCRPLHEQLGNGGNGQTQSADDYDHDAEGLHGWILQA